MNVINSVKDYVTNVLDFHQDSLSGAIDVVGVQQPDGNIKCSPFHVHFGRIELRKPLDKKVLLMVNGRHVDGVNMKLGAAGEAFFVDQVLQPVEEDYNTSPLVSPTTSEVGIPYEPMPPTNISSSTSSKATATETVVERVAHTKLEPLPESSSSLLPEPSQQHFPQWRDAYRVVADNGAVMSKEGADATTSTPSTTRDRLSWGWGALPIVKSSLSLDTMNLDEDPDEENHRIVKSESMYFDAVEPESSPRPGEAYPKDLPCMSLCGEFLTQGLSEEEMFVIFSEHLISNDIFRQRPVEIIQNPNLVLLIDGKLYPYTPEVQAHLLSRVLFPSSAPVPIETPEYHAKDLKTHKPTEHESSSSSTSTTSGPPSKRWYQWFHSSPTSSEPSSTTKMPLETPSISTNAEASHPERASSPRTSSFFFTKSLQPNQRQLAQMELVFGENLIEFVVQKGLESEVRITSKLFLWPVAAKVVICDIDGAISNVDGQSSRVLSSLLPIGVMGGFEKAFSNGIYNSSFEFFTRLRRNGYHIVYLTCHDVEYAAFIRGLLDVRASSARAEQSSGTTGNKCFLPRGPVLISPDRLLSSNEHGSTEAKEFKTAALNGIRGLFPSDVNPFYAAFGKSFTDSMLFAQAGVFPGKIFLMDHRDGQLRHRTMMNYKQSYASLLTLIDRMFPPLCTSPIHRSRQRSRSTGRKKRANSMQHVTSNGTENGSVDRKLSFDANSATSQGDGAGRVEIDPPLAQLQLDPQQAIPVQAYAAGEEEDEAEEEYLDDDHEDEQDPEQMYRSSAHERNMGDEAYNDVNFWRIKPGTV